MRRSRASVAWAELVALVAVVGVGLALAGLLGVSAARAPSDAARRVDGRRRALRIFVFARSATHCRVRARASGRRACVCSLVPKPATWGRANLSSAHAKGLARASRPKLW